MRKKLFVTLFSVCILMGATISFANLKSVKSLVSMNVEALTQRTWDGCAMGYTTDWDTGTCGVLGFSYGGSYGQYYSGYISLCHGSYSEINLYRKNGESWIYLRYCCDSCGSTSYCTDD